MKDKHLFCAVKEMVILLLLQKEEMHGYQIMRFLRRAMPTPFDTPVVTIYTTLKRLKRNGWIADQWVRTTRRRRVYRITPQGTEELRRQVVIWKKGSSAVDRLIQHQGLSE